MKPHESVQLYSSHLKDPECVRVYTYPYYTYVYMYVCTLD